MNALEVRFDGHRPEFYGESFQARLRPGFRLEIPEASIAKTKRNGGGGQNWQQREHRHREDWQRFTSGRRSRVVELSSVEIDGGASLVKPDAKELSGQERLELAYEAAARFEEVQRARRLWFGRR
jgi:hypothetical protein